MLCNLGQAIVCLGLTRCTVGAHADCRTLKGPGEPRGHLCQEELVSASFQLSKPWLSSHGPERALLSQTVPRALAGALGFHKPPLGWGEHQGPLGQVSWTQACAPPHSRQNHHPLQVEETWKSAGISQRGSRRGLIQPSKPLVTGNTTSRSGPRNVSCY